jgi:hypothetical protein
MTHANFGGNGDWFITLKKPIDEENDTLWTLGRSGLGGATYQFAKAFETLAPAIRALTAATPTNNNGRRSIDLSEPEFTKLIALQPFKPRSKPSSNSKRRWPGRPSNCAGNATTRQTNWPHYNRRTSSCAAEQGSLPNCGAKSRVSDLYKKT